ncbi:GH25 family lysozyme [Intrasporangium flavum]|uniref:GH25 family lysozyme n=1 Tax=Intrasporangium flavum TaxID=1428657 RepID=UPI00096C1056|nr:GH25 family lysozyme [Intrasporangium flavum]
MRRRCVKLLAVLVVLVVGGGALAYAAWPHYRPVLEDGEVYGVDVSSHQGDIDWRAVAADGVAAAYVKASEGGTYVDSTFVANWRGASAAGLRVGAYHFFTLCRGGDEQAANFLARLRQVHGTDAGRVLPPVVDLELGGNCSARPAAAVVDARLVDFVSRVEAATGRRVLLYVVDDYASRYPLPASLERDRWVRRLGLRPEGAWAWWQVHNDASVDGVHGPVDLDVARLDHAR